MWTPAQFLRQGRAKKAGSAESGDGCGKTRTPQVGWVGRVVSKPRSVGGAAQGLRHIGPGDGASNVIKGLFDHGATPVLERLVQFTAARQRVISHNIANMSTPRFRPSDVSVEGFQHQLAQAIDHRRATRGVFNGPLELKDTREVAAREDRLELSMEATNDNVLFHDQNNRSMEHQMKALAENAMTHNMAMELLKSEFDILRSAIREQA